MLLLLSADFFLKFFQEHYQCIKQFGSRSRPKFSWSRSRSKLFAKVIRRRQKSPLARKELSSHADISSKARGLNVGSSLHLHPFLAVADPEGVQGVRSNPPHGCPF